MAERVNPASPDIVDAFAEAIEHGHTLRSACGFIGVSLRAINQHLADGKVDIEEGRKTADAAFAHRYARARAARVNKWLGIVGQVAEGAEKDSDRRGSAQWLLEHCEPEEFGAKSKMEVTGKDGGAVQVQAGVVLLPATLSPDEWLAQFAGNGDADGK